MPGREFARIRGVLDQLEFKACRDGERKKWVVCLFRGGSKISALHAYAQSELRLRVLVVHNLPFHLFFFAFFSFLSSLFHSLIPLHSTSPTHSQWLK